MGHGNFLISSVLVSCCVMSISSFDNPALPNCVVDKVFCSLSASVFSSVSVPESLCNQLLFWTIFLLCPKCYKRIV